MRDKQYYRERFKEYPDVVTLEQFREMLGGIGDGTQGSLWEQGELSTFT